MRKAVFVSLFIVSVLAAFLLGRVRPRTSVSTASAESRILYYVDPMHPSYKADKPGKAPDCGMDLVPVYADGASPGDNSASGGSFQGSVEIDVDQQKLIGLRTATVEKSAGRENLRVLGKVALDDSRTYRITSGVDGWVQETRDASVGTFVKKDETLATFYSLEFTALEQGYLVASERMAGTTKQLAAPGTQSTSARLRNFGMGDKQIAEIAATRKMPEQVNITSPADAFIIARNIAPGMRFEKGTELYRLADLSRLWIVAEVVENEAQKLRPGTTVDVSIPGQQRSLTARVSGTLPQFDPDSRTMMVRLEVANPGYVLKPGMFVDLLVPVRVPEGLSIPVDALLDAGTEQRVFVAHQNSFETRSVATGLRYGDRIQILSGLSVGDEVVTSGNFLLDSESHLRKLSLTSEASRPGSIDVMKHAAMSAAQEAVPQPGTNPELSRSGRTIDAKCGMQIDRNASKAKGNAVTYRDHTYYFCSMKCKTEFQENPDKYIRAGKLL